jgi:crotonobetainyl-CoA:carnitine CoA-transferase CaiB-like acyl-CoA transferase
MASADSQASGTTGSKRPGALEGLRVVDVSRFIAGPYCAMLLGDMGADVVKVEPPGRGENSRAFGPKVEGESLYTMVFNRNKRSLALDLRAAEGQALLRELLATADVLVENFVPGTLEKMGCGWDVLHSLNPRLIATRISGFGQTGPMSRNPCFDVIAQAMSGLMDITGETQGRPTMAGTYIVDYSTGLYATIGTLGALQARHASGAGQVVDVALMDSAISMLMTAIPEQMLFGRTMQRIGNRDKYAGPANTFRTADGDWVHIVCTGDDKFRAFAAAIGQPELADDPRFATNAGRMENVEAMESVVASWTAGAPTAQVLRDLAAAGLPTAKVARIPDVVDNPQLAHRGQLLTMQHAKAGPVPMQGFAVQFADSPMQLRHPPPVLGQHTAEVLEDWLAASPERIAGLRSRKVIG